MTADELDDIIWLTPATYYTRCPDALATAIARDIALGASWQNTASKYGVRSRFREWMKWGAEAAMEDAGPEDYRAQWLNLFLKVQQAFGIAGVEAEQRLYQANYREWLTRHPDQRTIWGDGETSGALAIAPAEVPQVVDSTPETPAIELPEDPETIRRILKMMVEAGAAVPKPDTDEKSPRVDEGTGTNG